MVLDSQIICLSVLKDDMMLVLLYCGDSGARSAHVVRVQADWMSPGRKKGLQVCSLNATTGIQLRCVDWLGDQDDGQCTAHVSSSIMQ